MAGSATASEANCRKCRRCIFLILSAPAKSCQL
jgi:hypothetical protein